MDVASHQPGCVPDTTRFFITGIRSNRGFTLIELMVAVALLAILVGYAQPALQTLLFKEAQTTAINSLIGHLQLARSEAIMRNSDVVVCKSSDGAYCIKSGEWEQGWLVFEDQNHDRARDNEERILASHSRLTNIDIYYRAFGSNHYVTFHGNGLTTTNGTYTFCSPREDLPPQGLILYKTGRARISPLRNDGSPLRCPA